MKIIALWISAAMACGLCDEKAKAQQEVEANKDEL